MRVFLLFILPFICQISFSQKLIRTREKLTDENPKLFGVQYRLIATRQKTTSVKIIYDLIYDANGNLIGKEKSKSFTYDSSKEPKPKATNLNDGHNHVH